MTDPRVCPHGEFRRDCNYFYGGGDRHSIVEVAREFADKLSAAEERAEKAEAELAQYRQEVDYYADAIKRMQARGVTVHIPEAHTKELVDAEREQREPRIPWAKDR